MGPRDTTLLGDRKPGSWLTFKGLRPRARTGLEDKMAPHRDMVPSPVLITRPPSSLLATTRNTTDFRGQDAATRKVTPAAAQLWGTEAAICKLFIIFIKIKKLDLPPERKAWVSSGGAPSPAAARAPAPFSLRAPASGSPMTSVPPHSGDTEGCRRSEHHLLLRMLTQPRESQEVGTQTQPQATQPR